MYSKDYFLRQLEMMTEAISEVLFNKKDERSAELDFSIANGELWKLDEEIKSLLADGKINQAENLMFEYMNANPEQNIMLVAGGFYDEIAKLDDTKLAEYNFSRREIISGLNDIYKFYGIQLKTNDENL